MKTIEYTLTLTGITPADVQSGGVQGDHNRTALVFYLDQELWQDINKDVPAGHNIRCHVEVADGTGGFHASDVLAAETPPGGTVVPDNTARMITYTIPSEITLAGGVAQFFLVISDVDNDSLSSRTLYSFPARVRFDASAAGTNSADNYYGDVNGALDALLKAFPVGTEKIKDNAVTTDKLATGAVTADKLGAAAVTSAKIATGAVTSDKLESGAVTEAKIADGAVTRNKLKPGYISSDYINDLNNLKTPGVYRIFPNDTVEQHRPDGVNAMSVLVMDTGVTAGSNIYVQLAVSVTGRDLYIRASLGGTGGAGWTDWENIADVADGSITTAKLADSAVTAAKIADGAVTRDKLGQDIFWNYVTADFNTLTGYGLYVVRANGNAPSPDASTYALIVISDGNTVQLAITNSSNPRLYMRSLAAGNWSEWKTLGGDIPDGSITTTKLVDGAVTAEKLAQDVQSSIPRFGVCNTSQSTPDKVVELEGFSLYAGVMVAVRFAQGNSADGNLTLNINNTGAKPVYKDDSTVGTELALNWSDTVWFVYDGSYYQVIDIPLASTVWAGKVKLNDTLTSTSTTEALTAAQGKALKDMIDDLPGGGGSGGGLPFSSQYNFNIDEVTEDCIRVVGGTTTGTKPPCNNYALVTTFTPIGPSGYSDGGYMLQMAQSDNGKLYERHNYSSPPNWSTWQTGSN